MIIFAGVEILPGDACTQYLEQDQADVELLEKCRDDLNLNRPARLRYTNGHWAPSHTGDLGMSVNGEAKISDLVGARFANSLLLAFFAVLVGVPLAMLLGVITGLWRDRKPDIIFSSIAIFAMTIPEFVLATLLILVFSVWLGWLPGIVLTSAGSPISDFFPGNSIARLSSRW